MEGLISAVIPSAQDGWFMALYGLGIGLFIIPMVIEIFERRKQYQEFYKNLHGEYVGKCRSIYWMHLSRAYETWRQNNQDVPDSIEGLIESADFPVWLPVIKGDLIETVDNQYAAGRPVIWRFMHPKPRN